MVVRGGGHHARRQRPCACGFRGFLECRAADAALAVAVALADSDPDFITQAHLAAAVEAQIKKGKPAGIREVTLTTLNEGLCVQAMHIGAYASEMSTTIPAMYAYMAANGLVHRGLHHEIYLGDPDRVAPDKLKTILRQPVSRK